MQFTIIWFSVFTFVAGFTQDFQQLIAVRILQGLGFGGEGAAGAVLMGEIIRPEHRARRSAPSRAASGSDGAWPPSWPASSCAHVPQDYAWRVLPMDRVFSPASWSSISRRRLEEPEIYGQTRAAETRSGVRPGLLGDLPARNACRSPSSPSLLRAFG